MKVLLLFVLLSSFTYAADCYEELSQKYSSSSRVFHLSESEVEEYYTLDENKAQTIVDIIMKKNTSCSLKDLKNEAKSYCYDFKSARTCEVLTDVGYFIVHRSSIGHFEHSIIWTRWD